jgi:hypothetical protein
MRIAIPWIDSSYFTLRINHETEYYCYYPGAPIFCNLRLVIAWFGTSPNQRSVIDSSYLSDQIKRFLRYSLDQVSASAY